MHGTASIAAEMNRLLPHVLVGDTSLLGWGEQMVDQQAASPIRHFSALDGLRGVAALAVFGTHFFQAASKYYPLSRASLSVDFFFILSGFVLCVAYQDKMRGKMTRIQFFQARVFRLYPIIILSAAIAMLAAMIGGDANVLAWVAASLCLPIYGLGLDLFTLNGPEWSLFFELLASLGFAVGAFRLRNKTLYMAMVVGAVCYVGLARNGGVTGGFTWANAWQGFPRTGLATLVGVCLFRLYRSDKLPKIGLPFPVISLLLLGVMLVPRLPRADWMIAPGAVLVFFPSIVVLALNCRIAGSTKAVAERLGRLSYPLYLLHIPLIAIVTQVTMDLKLASPFVLGAVAAVIIAVSAGIERYYEAPAIRALKRIALPAPRAELATA